MRAMCGVQLSDVRRAKNLMLMFGLNETVGFDNQRVLVCSCR